MSIDSTTVSKNAYPSYDKEIKGLYHTDCSCDACRTTRINDKGYQEYLRKKWAAWLEEENKRTEENCREHDRINSIRR